MNWIIPGTTLTGLRSNADRTDGLFASMFLAGGLTLSQVSSITGLENYVIQNWVKRGFLPPPQNKRYDMEQLCRLLNQRILGIDVFHTNGTHVHQTGSHGLFYFAVQAICGTSKPQFRLRQQNPCQPFCLSRFHVPLPPFVSSRFPSGHRVGLFYQAFFSRIMPLVSAALPSQISMTLVFFWLLSLSVHCTTVICRLELKT